MLQMGMTGSLPCSVGTVRTGDLCKPRSALTGRCLVRAVAGGAQSGGLTVLAERPPRNPDCLAAGGRGLRQAAHMPRCSFIRLASASLGGSSVSSLTRLPYLQRKANLRLVPCCCWLCSNAYAFLPDSKNKDAICSSLAQKCINGHHAYSKQCKQQFTWGQYLWRRKLRTRSLAAASPPRLLGQRPGACPGQWAAQRPASGTRAGPGRPAAGARG